MPRRAVSPLPEDLELDTTLHLPAFLPPAFLGLRGEEWPLADRINWEHEAPGGTAGQLTRGGESELVFGEPAPVRPMSSCPLDPMEPAPAVFDPEAITEGQESFEELADRLVEEAVPFVGGGDRECEERGMSETVETLAAGIGARIAHPFLQEPQPWPGSGKPRWSPATVSLGAGDGGATPERSMEDWDIL
jgi:hypothetical protein